MTSETSSTVQSVDRALKILEALSKQDSMSLVTLSEETGLHKATAHRLVNTLLVNGYIEQNPSTKHYAISLKLFELGNSKIQNIDFLNVAKSMIQQLALDLGQTVHLVIDDNDSVLYIDKYQVEKYENRMKSKIGKRAPMYCTAVGKAILATHTNAEITDFWNRNEIQQFTRNTLTNLDDFLKEIEEIRRKGYAMDNQEHEYGVVCVGAAFSSYNQVAAGAMSVSIPIEEFKDEEKYIQKTLDTAHQTSRLLGSFF
ncbi:IclR family transcriptional regulator [Lacticigenium naphthae]|uniref:IclR family transcriptional regulator n=1 Tax=Lacticigenium naphthae TaxID=515351 RepID=UPI000412DE7E|nr:IclR family transcriptional regulator [Lacticigenium naphthae]